MTDEQLAELQERESAAYKAYTVKKDEADALARTWVTLSNQVETEKLRREYFAQFEVEARQVAQAANIGAALAGGANSFSAGAD